MRCRDVMQAARDPGTLPIRQGWCDPAATDRGDRTRRFHGARGPPPVDAGAGGSTLVSPGVRLARPRRAPALRRDRSDCSTP
jgi:hypothetical protein